MEDVDSLGNTGVDSVKSDEPGVELPTVNSCLPLKCERDWDEYWLQWGTFFRKLPEAIDSNIWFHGVYGFLDGLSVAYSTIKFTCELISKDNKEYHHNLDSVLVDWVYVVIACTAVAVAFSTIGNFASKKDKDKRSDIEKLCCTWLPYIRDALKGAKNGYKAIKTLVMVLVHHNLLDNSQTRYVALPIGLIFSITAVINRYIIRVILDEKKKIASDIKKISKQLQKANQIQLELSTLQAKLFSIHIKLDALDRIMNNKCDTLIEQDNVKEKKQPFLAQEEELKKLINQKSLELSEMNVDDLKNQRKGLSVQASNFLDENGDSLLFAKALGGFIDAPYLYLGVMSLVVLTMPAFIITSSILSCFLVACIAVRYNEAVKEKKELSAAEKVSELDAAIAAYNYQQERVLELNLENFNKFRKTNKRFYPKEQIEKEFEDFKKASQEEGGFKEGWQKELENLHALFEEVDKVNDQLKDLVTPTLAMAILEGIQDGLSAFGALASTYFLLAIVFLMTGAAFPPALIVGGAIFGLVAIAGFVCLRLNQLSSDLSDRELHYRNWKEYNRQQLFHIDSREELLLSPLDCNTDGLTKGEFFWQRQFEIVRCFTNGPYKAENLTDFILNELDDHFAKLITLFWGACSLVYCAVLALRAVGQMSKDKAYKPFGSLAAPILPPKVVLPVSDSTEGVKQKTDGDQPNSCKINPPAPAHKVPACIGFRQNFFQTHKQQEGQDDMAHSLPAPT